MKQPAKSVKHTSELVLIRVKWSLVAYAARSRDNSVAAGGASVSSPLNIRTLLVSLVVWRVGSGGVIQ